MGIFCISVFAFFDIAIVPLDNFREIYECKELSKETIKMVGHRLSFVDN